MKKREKWNAGVRAAGCCALLALLAVCGYWGARQQPVKAVSVPVAAKTVSAREAAAADVAQIKARLTGEREEELALLQSVIDHPSSDEALVRQALAQKAQIAGRMETEAQTEACLALMGYEEAAVICGGSVVTIVAPWDDVPGEEDRVRIIGAAAAQAQTEPEAVKIILAKK